MNSIGQGATSSFMLTIKYLQICNKKIVSNIFEMLFGLMLE